jgi:hypothetical protein
MRLAVLIQNILVLLNLLQVINPPSAEIFFAEFFREN